MVKFRCKTLLFLGLSLLLLTLPIIFSSICRAAESAPNLKGWVQKVGGYHSKKRFPQRLLMISGWKDKFFPKILHFKEANFIGGGTLVAVSQSSVDWSYKLNFWPGSKPSTPLSLSKRTSQAAILTQADSFIIFPENPLDQWHYLHWNGVSVDLFVKMAPAGDKSPASIKQWMAKMLGYNGVVLDQQNQYILVGSLVSDFQGETLQGLVIRESHRDVQVKPHGSEGMGLLSFVSGKGAYAVFRIIFLEKGLSHIPVGSKVLMEKLEDR